MGEPLGLVQLGEPAQAVIEEADKLDRTTIPAGGGPPLVAGLEAGPHLVHPGQAVSRVASPDEAGLLVQEELDVEPGLVHVAVQPGTSPGLSELDAHRVRLEHLARHLLEGEKGLLLAVVAGQPLLQHFPVLGHLHVIRHALQEPPDSIPAVVAGPVPEVEQVGDQSQPKLASELQQDSSGLLVHARQQQSPLEGDERVPAPAARPPRRKVRQACRHGDWHVRVVAEMPDEHVAPQDQGVV